MLKMEINHQDAMLRLTRDILRRLQSDEFSELPLRGVQDVSKSDLEKTLVCIKSLNKNQGACYCPGLTPSGKVKELLQATGLHAE